LSIKDGNVAKHFLSFVIAVGITLWVLTTAHAAGQEQGKPMTGFVRPSMSTVNQELVVGSEEDFPPFATGKTDSAAGGFTVELWKAVAKEVGLKYSIRVRPFHQLLQEFKEGKIDVLINLAMSDERRLFADFTVPHVTVHGAIFVRKGQTAIHSDSDLSGKSIIVLKADLAHDYARSRGWGDQLVLVDNAEVGLRLLASGQHDAMLLSKLAGLQTIQSHQLPGIEPLQAKAGFAQKFAFVTHRGHSDLLAQLNEGLALTKANGVYDTLYEKWFGVYETRELSTFDLFKYIGPVVAFTLIWMGYFYYRRQRERNLAALEIAESRELLMTIIDTAPVRVFWKDQYLRYLGCNTAFAVDAGMDTSNEVIGKDDFQMGWAEQAQLYRADDLSVMTSGQSKVSYAEPQTTPDGRTIWLRTSKVPLKGHDGKIFGVLGVYDDVTAQRESQELVRLAAQYARNLIETSLDPLVTISALGKITDVNTATERVTGVDRESLIGSDFAGYFTEPMKAQEGYERVFSQGKVTDYPLALRHASGKITDVIYNASVYKDESGNVVGVIAAARDVTARKLVEDELKKSEAFKNVILNSVDAEIAVLDHDGFILAINNPWRRFAQENQRIAGKSEASVEVGANYLTVCEASKGIDAAEAMWVSKGIRSVLNGELPRFSHEYACHSPTDKRWFRMVVLPLGGGEGSGVVITHTNITERVQSEEERASALGHLQKIASRLPGMVYQYRLRKDGSSCFPYASDAIREIYQVTPEDVREDASKAFSNIHPDDCDGIVASIQKSAQELTPLQHEYRVKFMDGTVRWLFGNAVPELDDDGSTLWHGFIMDITDRRNVDETLRKLSTAVEQSMASVVITDLNSRIEYVNPQFTKVSGYSSEEAIGQNPRILQSKQTKEQSYQEMWLALSSGQPWHGELINRRKNGEVYWEESHIAPITNSDGSITHYVAIKTEITERIRSAEKIDNLLREQKKMLNNDLVGIVTVKDRHFVWANPAFEAMFGYELGELVGLSTHVAFLSDQAYEDFGASAYALIKAGDVFRTRSEMRRKDGCTIWVDVSGEILNQSTGDSLWSFLDVTKRVQAENLLLESEAHLQAIIENEPECIKVVNARGELVQMNPAGLAMIEADSFLQVKGVPVLEIIAPEFRDAFSDMHKRVIAGESVQLEFQVQGLKGGMRWLETHAVPMKERGEIVHLAVTRDITQRKEMEDQVRQLALHDALTNLPNRRLLLDRLSQAMANSKRSGCYCALMYLDLDNFKALNDTHGHSAGDLLLLEAARRLMSCVREVDTVSRFGGDEFVVLLGELVAYREESTAQAAVVAEKIRDSLQEPYLLKIGNEGAVKTTIEHHCTASIGVSIFLDHELSQDDILKFADSAMYRAKGEGRNLVRFHDVLSASQ